MALTEKLKAIADAIRGKTGKTDGLTLDQMATEIEGIQSGGEGETMRNMISKVLSLVPVFDDTWTTAKFTLTSNQTSDRFTIPNPLGAVPSMIYILKTDIDYSIRPQVIGGYNVGNTLADCDDNRTIALDVSNKAGNAPKEMINQIGATNWNFQNASSGAATAEVITPRAGGSAGLTMWLAGEYIVAVK